MTQKSPILEIKNLSKQFGEIHAVNNCSFDIAENSITGMIGPNGAGKTTTFELITGLEKPTKGEIWFKQENITHLPTFKRAKLGITRTYQKIRIFPELTVLDNIMVVLMKEHQGLRHIFTPKKIFQKHAEKAREILRDVGIEEKAHLYAKDVSYGQQKLLEIARAVATDADLFLLDEPAAGVNLTMLKRIEKILMDLHQKGKTLLIVEHNMPFVMSFCEKIIVLDYGTEIAIGKPEDIQRNDHVLEAYLGKKSS